jgi:hypothetical protein
MATIITKNSQTASAVPSAASLAVGELAVNTADGKLYTEHTGGVVKEIIPSTVVDGGITTAKIADGAVTSAKIADGTIATSDLANSSVTVAKISASGTPSSSTFLRGDGSWAAGGGGDNGRGQVFTSSGTFTIPSGTTAVKVTVIGGGGNGANMTPANGTAGGGGGGTSIRYITNLVPGNTVSVTVGGAGGTSSFGAFCSATGGVSPGTNSRTAGAGGNGTGGDINIPGGSGGSGGYQVINSYSGETFYSMGGGGATNYAPPGQSSFWGIGPSTNAFTTTSGGFANAGSSGTGFGAGGGGAAGNNGSRNGGAGTPGIVFIEW